MTTTIRRRWARACPSGLFAASIAAAAALAAALAQETLPEGTQIAAVLSTDDFSTKSAQVVDGFTMDIVAPYFNGVPVLASAKLRGNVADVTQAGQGKNARLTRLRFHYLPQLRCVLYSC